MNERAKNLGGQPAPDLPSKEAGSRSIPAVIFFTPPSPVIAALSLLDRLIMALDRGGAGPITIVCDCPLPRLERSRAWGVAFTVASEIPPLEGPVLLARGNVVVQKADVAGCITIRGRLISAAGTPIPFGVTRAVTEQVEQAIEDGPQWQAEGVVDIVNDAASARRAEAALWRALSSAQDGLVDRSFNRPCGRPLSKLLIHTPITPNMVSIASILVGVAAAFMFGVGTYQSVLWGAIVFQLSAIIDCVDGDIARMVFKESALGKWIDLTGDQVVHVSVFAGIAAGLARATPGDAMFWLGVSAVLGAIISFGVVVRGMRAPGGASGLFKRMIDSVTNRDFSVIVLLLAIFGRIDLFLWLAAIGSHLFWIAALSLQTTARDRR